MRDKCDRRGWLLIIAVLVIGYEWWWFDIDRVLKPAVVFVVSGWLIWLTVRPERWRELIGDAVVAPSPPAP
jgi:hypothetical protein